MGTSYDGDEPCNTLILDFKTLRASLGAVGETDTCPRTLHTLKTKSR